MGVVVASVSMGSIVIVRPCDRTATLVTVSRRSDAQILTGNAGNPRQRAGESGGDHAAKVPAPLTIRPPNRRDKPVATILREWRRLTSLPGARRAGPGAPTLVACSGGADSAALVLALAAAGSGAGPIVVAHIVHDLRDPVLALADRDAVRALAAALGLKFVEAAVHIKALRGNAEALARRERYAALAQLARDSSVKFIATAHHADDQLESILMALVRGAGPRALAGVAPSRRLTRDTTIIRPMLGVTRADAQAICRAAGYEPRIDHTNADTSRLRSAIRTHVTPALRALRPAAALKSAQAASLLAGAAGVIRTSARRTLRAATPSTPAGITLERRALRKLPEVVLGETLRLAARQIAVGGAGEKGSDKRASRPLAAIVRAVHDHDGSTRRFTVGGVHFLLTADSLTISPAPPSPDQLPESPRADRPRPPDRRPDRSR